MGWAVNAMPPGKDPVPTVWEAGWGPRAGLNRCGKIWPHTGIRSSDRPARSESLYRLSRPGPLRRGQYTVLIFLTLDKICLCVVAAGGNSLTFRHHASYI
jgi:hypothetical protein